PGFVAELHERTGIHVEFLNCGSFEVILDDQQYRMAASECEAAEAYREVYGRAVLELLTPEAAREQEPNLAEDILGVKSCPVSCQVRNPLLVRAVRAAC